jgi:chemotaxis signal transduction protein
MDMHVPYVDEDLLSADESIPNVPRAKAYLLEYRQGCFVAFPAHTGVELIDQPVIVMVPGIPYFCLGLMAWQGRRLPVLDLDKFLTGPGVHGKAAVGHVLILAYQSARGRAVEYGAVLAPSLIEMIEVMDSQQCALPADIERLPGIALSCFEYQTQAVPVLDTARIFSRPDS